jgi:hypothetical protein
MGHPVGTRLRSAVDETEVVVVRAPSDNIDIRCGGQSMLPLTPEAVVTGSVDPRHSGGTLVGKRYVNEELNVELLCTKGGKGSLAVGDTPLLVKAAKPLPSSD